VVKKRMVWGGGAWRSPNKDGYRSSPNGDAARIINYPWKGKKGNQKASPKKRIVCLCKKGKGRSYNGPPRKTAKRKKKKKLFPKIQNRKSGFTFKIRIFESKDENCP